VKRSFEVRKRSPDPRDRPGSSSRRRGNAP